MPPSGSVSTRMSVIRVGIVEDQAPLRKRVAEHFAFMADLQLTVSAGSGEQFLDRLEAADPAKRPHVVLMDIELPGWSGIETTRRLKAAHPDIQVLIFTIFEDDERIFDSIRAGASGYLLKDEPADAIAQALRELHAGGAPMSAVVARQVLALMRRGTAPEPTRPDDSGLTDRELDILNQLAAGKSNQDIGTALFLSPLTVKTHIANIYRKLHVSSRAEATRAALERRLVR